MNDEIKSTSSSVTNEYQQLKKQFEELKASNDKYQRLEKKWKKNKAQSIDLSQ